MHFRVRPSAIQAIRSQYDPATKRTTSTVVARIPRASLRLSDEDASKLSKEDKAKIETYLEAYRSGQGLQPRLYAHKLPDIIGDVARYYESLDDEAERDLIGSHMAQAIVDLRRTLNQAKA